MSSQTVSDTVKVNVVNAASLFAAWELADVQAILSILVLSVSFVYTCVKLAKELKK